MSVHLGPLCGGGYTSPPNTSPTHRELVCPGEWVVNSIKNVSHLVPQEKANLACLPQAPAAISEGSEAILCLFWSRKALTVLSSEDVPQPLARKSFGILSGDAGLALSPALGAAV